MKKYKKYNDSGIEFIGKIPEDWVVQRLNNVGKFSSSGIDKKTLPDQPIVKMINYTDVYGNERRILDNKKEYMVVSATKEQKENHGVQKGDLIFTPSSETEADIGVSALVDCELPDTVFSYHVLKFKFEKEVNHNFKKYLCNNYNVLYQFSARCKGTTRQILGRDEFKNTLIILPPIQEQKAIAEFLDNQTQNLDSLVEKRKQMVELLKEERTAIINQAVTKGINPTTKMKDSGIDWVGEIPEHWKVKRLKYLAEIETGGKDTINREEDGKFPFYVRSMVVERINSFSFDGEAVLTAGDGVGVGEVFHYVNGKFDFHQRVYSISNFKEILGKYFYYFIKENLPKEIIKHNAKSTVDSLRLPMFKSFRVAYGTREEQEEIVKYIETETAKIDKTLLKIEKEIALLDEYKTALISEAVTGKIDVRVVA